jgi:hypothetical protein
MTTVLQRLSPAKQRSFDALKQGMSFERLAQDTKSARFQSRALQTILDSCTDHDHGYAAGISVQSLLELNPTQSRHKDVSDDALADLLPSGIEKVLSGVIGARTKTLGPHKGGDGRAGWLIIVNDRNDRAIHD